MVDGYCDVCGSPAVAPPAPAGGTSVTRASVRLSSALIGSQRVAGTAPVTRRTTSSRIRSQRLGAGLTTVPPAPPVEPSASVMTDPAIPENRRNCPHCGQPVGRSIGDQPGRLEGFCPNCRKPYSFTPKLAPGDLIANQYEIIGPLAHGGMGWVYLGFDRNVSDRRVVLKGILNAGDADALAAAIAEQRFLAQVDNPLLVEIYNFVEHEGAGYIVMEYVGGRSLKQFLAERREANGGVYDPLPVDQALAFVLELLPAFSYLHESGLLYCDLKPENVIQVGDSLKLIDLGGVRRIDDDHSPIFGTVGYQAPEVATVGPSVASDIYTIGRTLLVLVAEVKEYQGAYADRLPPLEDVPAFQRYDSLFRLAQKCCAPAAADRFTSADELQVQVLGVLREVVGAERPGVATSSGSSLLFEPPLVFGDSVDWRQLPRLRRDTTDPNYAWLSSFGPDADPIDVLSTLERPPTMSAEVLLLRGDAALRLGRHDIVRDGVNALLTADPWEWRAIWLAGLDAVVTGDLQSAQSSFNAVYGQLPGELAPKLALAVACEKGGEVALAEALYETCASTDANYVTAAAFGLARIRAGRRDLPGVLAALDLVQPTSRGYGESRRLKAQHLLELGSGLADLSSARRLVQTSRLDPPSAAEFEVRILERALAEVLAAGVRPGTSLGDIPATPELLRRELEQAYRHLAQFTSDPAQSTLLVDLANQTRKWSLL
ncbi:tetratricopeptide repeat protein [Propionicicella superfundia]|uniref:serine/threonine-protein kinase n=1 Tax=Propionicicella superfundia TaxID=348582 RepID=UPI003CCBCC88